MSKIQIHQELEIIQTIPKIRRKFGCNFNNSPRTKKVKPQAYEHGRRNISRFAQNPENIQRTFEDFTRTRLRDVTYGIILWLIDTSCHGELRKHIVVRVTSDFVLPKLNEGTQRVGLFASWFKQIATRHFGNENANDYQLLQQVWNCSRIFMWCSGVISSTS